MVVQLVCERCGVEEKQTLTADPATCPHNEDDIGIYNDHEATCTEDGYTGDTYCTACGTLLEKGEVDEKAHGHDWEEDSNACQLPTCTESGKDFYVCRECGEREERVTQPLGHSWEKTKVTPATCTKDGKTVYTCSTCDETKEEITEKATGHKWNDGEVTTAPTTTSTGVKTFTCLTCGKQRQKRLQNFRKKASHLNRQTPLQKVKRMTQNLLQIRKMIQNHLQIRRMIQNHLQTRRITLQW